MGVRVKEGWYYFGGGCFDSYSLLYLSLDIPPAIPGGVLTQVILLMLTSRNLAAVVSALPSYESGDTPFFATVLQGLLLLHMFQLFVHLRRMYLHVQKMLPLEEFYTVASRTASPYFFVWILFYAYLDAKLSFADWAGILLLLGFLGGSAATTKIFYHAIKDGLRDGAFKENRICKKLFKQHMEEHDSVAGKPENGAASPKSASSKPASSPNPAVNIAGDLPGRKETLQGDKPQKKKGDQVVAWRPGGGMKIAGQPASSGSTRAGGDIENPPITTTNKKTDEIEMEENPSKPASSLSLGDAKPADTRAPQPTSI